MGIEELLRHGGRDAVAPLRGQRPQDRRHVEMALMIRREDDRRFQRAQIFESVRL